VGVKLGLSFQRKKNLRVCEKMLRILALKGQGNRDNYMKRKFIPS
jgi:hypothetical protein